MFKKAEHQITILIHDLERKGDLTDREVQIGRDCYLLGKLAREQEIIHNRKLFEEGRNEE